LTIGLAQIGTDLSQPFLPLYVRELGVSDLHEAALLSILTSSGQFGGALSALLVGVVVRNVELRWDTGTWPGIVPRGTSHRSLLVCERGTNAVSASRLMTG
jgi:hypothetical protein